MDKTSETRRRLILGALGAAALPGRASADSYPSKPIRLIVPWPAGGVADVVTRRLAPHVEASLGQPIVVENRPGATGQLGAQFVARAMPDGYTLLRADSVSLVLAPSFAAEPLYDPLKEFTPISMHGRSSMMLVVPPSLGVSSLKDLIALARSKPGELSYAGTLGGANYVVTEKFKQLAQVDLRLVSYKGEGPALPDVVAGHVQVLFAFNSVAVPLVKAGKLKALVVTGDKAVPATPDVPTVIQAGFPDLLFTAWGGFFAPRGTPRPIIDKLSAVISRAIAHPDIQAVARDAGAEPFSSTPEECAQILRADLEKWRPVIAASGVRL